MIVREGNLGKTTTGSLRSIRGEPESNRRGRRSIRIVRLVKATEDEAEDTRGDNASRHRWSGTSSGDSIVGEGVNIERSRADSRVNRTTG